MDFMAKLAYDVMIGLLVTYLGHILFEQRSSAAKPSVQFPGPIRPPVPPRPVILTLARSVVKCLHCGTENPDKYTHCARCGKLLYEYCPNCGLKKPVIEPFCGRCGKSPVELRYMKRAMRSLRERSVWAATSPSRRR